ncbi:hypothetical protein CRG98_036028 [Punica granatum]|uniref:Protein DA1-like domain-containing protein n=1 Tax=Punica granatum TaxID=22663 RepID=A0A2I0IHX9_PUNGR|nr:hypothetical protein CRG98_036028 [Punica granatum]
MDTGDCQPLYHAIRDYYEGMNMKLDQQIPMLLVERQAPNEAIVGEKNGNYHMPDTRGLCLSEEQTVTSILKRPRLGGHKVVGMRTHPRKLTRKCEVAAILVLYGLPRLAHDCPLPLLRALPECTLEVCLHSAWGTAVPPAVEARTAARQAAATRGGWLEGEEVVGVQRVVDARWELRAQRVYVEGAALGGPAAARVVEAEDVVPAESTGPARDVAHDEVAGEGGGARGALLVEVEEVLAGAEEAAVPPTVTGAIATVTLKVDVYVDEVEGMVWVHEMGLDKERTLRMKIRAAVVDEEKTLSKSSLSQVGYAHGSESVDSIP